MSLLRKVDAYSIVVRGRKRQSLPLQPEICCLDDIINDLIEEFAALAIASQITLTSSIRFSQPLNVIGNEDQLYRLLSNLIVNAIQYTPQGGKVKVCLERSDYYAVIQVQDTGIGIPQQELTRIFDRFYRVNSDRSRSTGGSGLGLAIAQAIVQAHHGSLDVQSELGKGSTFTVKLPRQHWGMGSLGSVGRQGRQGSMRKTNDH